MYVFNPLYVVVGVKVDMGDNLIKVLLKTMARQALMTMMMTKNQIPMDNTMAPTQSPMDMVVTSNQSSPQYRRRRTLWR